MESNKRNGLGNEGFSLLEMIIGLAISSMVILACYSFLATGTKSYQSNSYQAELQEEMQITNNFIADVITTASKKETTVNVNATSSTITTDKYILYYQKDKGYLCLYDIADKDNVGNQSKIGEHVITDCIESMNLYFLPVSEGESIVKVTESAGTVSAPSGLMQIEVVYKKKGYRASSKKIYYMRNQ